MKNFFKTSFIVFFFLLADSLFAQIGVTYYTPNIMAFNTGKNHKVNGELKLFATKDIENLPIEIDVFYNFNKHQLFGFSVGAGLKVDVFTGESAAVTVPFKLEVIPFQQYKNVSFLYEIAPEIYFNDGNTSLRNLLGLRYTFLK